MQKFVDWAKREYSLGQRLLALIPAGVLIVLLIPLGIVVASAAIDHWLGLQRFIGGVINIIVALILALAGYTFAFWSIGAQIDIGRGTPLPMMPTQQLVVQKPFTYCRNPMTLGTILVYSALVVWLGSISAAVITLILMTLLILYIKQIEEKELEARFGENYREYRRKTPFILPRFRA